MEIYLITNRVVVTGIGMKSPVGSDKISFFNSICNGISGIDSITLFDASGYATKIAGEVRNFDPSEYINKKDQRKMDRFVQFAVCASIDAFRDANLDMNKIDPYRVGVIIGSGIGGMKTWEIQHTRLLEMGPDKVSPFLIPMMIIDMASGQVSITLGAKGPNYAVVTACASASNAIGESFKIIQRGDADIIISGGSEAAISPIGVAGFCSAKALSKRNDDPKRASRPFEINRDGFVMSEGSGIVILEELEHAKKRGVQIYAEIVGYGATGDAYHMTAPAPNGEGAARAMKMCMNDANVLPEHIDYINAHGTSTMLNDKYETTAIKTVMGEHAYTIPVSSTKSTTGHLLGAAGAVELIACIMAMQHSKIPPTINYENPDPECDLDYVPNTCREKSLSICMSNSFGFGGHNAVLLVKKYEGYQLT